MSSSSFQRARSPEAKRCRERASLHSARTLASGHGVWPVTLTDIAAAVGMHTSALLRYFETREQIFLVITAEWSGDVRVQLDGLPFRAENSES